jgi:hypothetical protein
VQGFTLGQQAAADNQGCSQFRELEDIDRRVLQLTGGQLKLEGIELRSQFNKGNDKVFQYQLALVLPGTRKMLALSYVKADKLGDAEAAHWALIKNSLSFDAIS